MMTEYEIKTYFPLGSRVVCIDAEDSVGLLNKDSIYFVEKHTQNAVNGDWLLKLENVGMADCGWIAERFTLDKFAVGEKIRCVDADGTLDKLILGDIYTVHHLDGSYIAVSDLKHKWDPTRFVPVREATDLPTATTTPIMPTGTKIEYIKTQEIDFRYYGFSSREEMLRTIGI